MIIQAEPTRVLPIALHPEIVRRIIAGRIRTIHHTCMRFDRLVSGDALWVREWLTIPRCQTGENWLTVVHDGDGVSRDIRWPKVIARPSQGRLPASAMPVHASRLTLIVTAVRVMRLHAVSEISAVAAGVDIDLGGFANPLHANQFFPTAAEAFGRMWDCALDGDAFNKAWWMLNPEIVEIGIRAVARNIADLVPGIGSGGVR